MGENFEAILDNYFNDFKYKMKNSMEIPKSVVDHYFDDRFFMVDTNYIYAQAVLPRVAWLRPMEYEVNVDKFTLAIIELLYKEIDKNVEPFKNYESSKIEMLVQTKVPKMDRK